MDEKKQKGVQPEEWAQVRSVLLEESKADEHIAILKEHKDVYLLQLRYMIERKVYQNFSTVQKGRIFASCLLLKEKETAQMLLDHPSFLGLGEILRAVQLLDAPRQVRYYERKLQRLEDRRKLIPRSVKKRTLTKLKTKIHNFQQECIAAGTFSGARANMIRKWAQSLPRSKLEFFLLHFPPENWKMLADVIHLRKDDFQLPYFLPVIYGEQPPKDSLVYLCKTCTPEEIPDVLTKYPEMANNYSYLRKKFSEGRDAKNQQETKVQEIVSMGFSERQAKLALRRFPNNPQGCVEWILEKGDALKEMPDPEDAEQDDINPRSKALFAKYMPLEELLWWYHELATAEVEQVVYDRLTSGEEIKDAQRSSYGKLLERLLYFREKKLKFAPLLLPYAERRLKALDIPATDNHVAVIGDASGSMEVAIKCAASLGSLLSATLKADLIFFNNNNFAPSVIPRTAAQAIQVVEEVKAAGGTAMAAGLWPFYEKKKKIDLFILVSDEEENAKYNGYYFAQLFKKYCDEINPTAKVILVSFLAQSDKGLINKNLQAIGIHAQQFRLDKSRPDTSKFDALLGLVTLETTFMEYRSATIKNTLQLLKLADSNIKIVLDY